MELASPADVCLAHHAILPTKGEKTRDKALRMSMWKDWKGLVELVWTIL